MNAKVLIRSLLTVCVAAFVSAVLADRVEPNQRVEWLTSVPEGLYTDASSWTGGVVPANGIDGKYGLIDFRTADITVRIPEGGFVDNSGTIFLGGGAEKHKLTLDTRGTYWQKKGVKAANESWGVTFATDIQSQRMFEAANCSTAENTNTIWTLSDGVLTWEADSKEHVFDLLSGTFSFDTELRFGWASNDKHLTFRVHPEATFKYATRMNFCIYGTTPTDFIFLGGNHLLNATWVVGMWAAQGATANLVLTNDAEVAIDNIIMLGGSDSGYTRGRIDTYGTSFFNQKSGWLRVGTSWNCANYKEGSDSFSHNDGTLALHDSSRALLMNGLSLAEAACSTGTVIVADNAALSMGPNDCPTYIGMHTDSHARVTVQDNGSFTYYKRLFMGADGVASALLEVKDNGRVIAAGADAIITNKCPSYGISKVSLSGNAFLSTLGIIGSDSADEPKMLLEADGGTIAAVTGIKDQVLCTPFLSGCALTLNKGGLTIDDVSNDLEIDQAFTDGDSAATLTKTGGGTMTVLRNSSHSNTHIANGGLRLGSGVTKFGKNLSFDQGTLLAFTDSDACLEAESLTFDTRLNLSLPTTLAAGTEYTLLKLTTPLTEEQVANIVVASGASDKVYAFATAADGTLKVTPSDYTPVTKTWTGGEVGTWQTVGNWSPENLPALGDAVKFASTAAVALTGVGSSDTITVDADAAVSVTGTGAVQVNSGVSLAEGAALELGVTTLGTGQTFTKTGKGALTISGNNAGEMTDSWNLEGGMTTFATEKSLGVDIANADAIAVSNCTFRYAGETPAVTTRPLSLTSTLPSVLDIEGDLTFDNFKVSYPRNDAMLVKTGAGKLTLNVPEGTTYMGAYSWTGINNFKQLYARGDNPFTVDESGETTSNDGVSYFSVLDGRCEIVGQGADTSKIDIMRFASLGGGGYTPKGVPELVFKNCYVKFGNSGGHMFELDPYAAPDHPGSHFVVLDNAYVDGNEFFVGGSRHKEEGKEFQIINPVLAITNATFCLEGRFYFPNQGDNFQYCKTTARIGKGGVLRFTPKTSKYAELYLGSRLDMWIEDGGLFDAVIPQQIFFTWVSSGAIHVTRGGGISTSRILSEAPAVPDKDKGDPLAIILDGGYLEFKKNNGLSANYDARVVPYIRVDEGGGEIRVGEGISHALSMVITGEGCLTKTGAGTLVLTNDIAYAGKYEKEQVGENEENKLDDENMYIPIYNERNTTNLIFTAKGGIVIDEGTLVAVAGKVPDGTAISGKGTLSGVFKSLKMSVKPGATTGLTLKDFTATKLYVDMGLTEADTPPDIGTLTWIAKLADGATFDPNMWKFTNVGTGRKVELSLSDEGVITAKTVSSGFLLIIK